jgi:hypothetical protein
MHSTLLATALVLASAGAAAQTVAPPPTATTAKPAPAGSITTLQAITVTGVMPGPGLWKVTHGNHVLWVLGVVPTLPAQMQWRSTQVAQTIAASQTVLESPDVKLKVDTNWFGKLFLLPSVYRAQRNPDGKTLNDVLPPNIYARWYYTRQHYFGDDYSIDRYRPIVAAFKLMDKAMKANGLRGNGEVLKTVKALAEQDKVQLVKPRVTLEIKEPRQAVKAFAAEGPDGIECLGLVLDVVSNQLPNFRARANAWATGDIDTLRKVPESAYRDTCKSAITGAGFAKALGIDNLPTRIENAWLTAADAALAANTQSFAVLPMRDVLSPHGYLAAMQARGYIITAPDADAADPASGGSAAAPASAGSSQ